MKSLTKLRITYARVGLKSCLFVEDEKSMIMVRYLITDFRLTELFTWSIWFFSYNFCLN